QEKNDTGFQTNQINVSDGNSNKVNNPLFRLMEERYGIQIIDEILVGIDSIDEKNRTKKIPCQVAHFTFEEIMEDILEVVDVKDKDIKTVDDIYNISFTGYNSSKHPINQGDSRLYFHSLIPIIILVRNDIEYPTRLDSHNLRDLFYDSEFILNSDKDNPDLTGEKLNIVAGDYYLEQLDLLDEIFNVVN
ncbi:MAG: hypothetical protein WCJ61_13665, partial [Paludibacter sp.]